MATRTADTAAMALEVRERRREEEGEEPVACGHSRFLEAPLPDRAESAPPNLDQLPHGKIHARAIAAVAGELDESAHGGHPARPGSGNGQVQNQTVVPN